MASTALTTGPPPPRRKPLTRLRDAAVGYVRVGWPILPASPTGDRLVAGRGPVDVATAHEWWSERPYGIACRVGEEFDVVQVPVWLGELVLAGLRRKQVSVPPPVIEIPGQGCWLFLVTPLARRIPELAAHGPVRLRRDIWILLPPTPLVGGAVLWVGQPPVIDLSGLDRLPHSLHVQWAAYHALREHAVTGRARHSIGAAG